MAEFAKEAMQGQSLDKKECIYIRWAADDEGGSKAKFKNQQKVEENILLKAIEKKQREVSTNERNKIIN
jgi:hypothetical protein